MRKIIYEELSPLEVYALVVTGKLKKFPNGYLNKERIKEIVRNQILNVYRYAREDILTLQHSFFQENFLGGARKFFNDSNVSLLIYSFPEWNLKHWEFNKVPSKFWKEKSNQEDFVNWIAEKEGLDLNNKEHVRKITADIIEKYGGSKPMIYAGGIYELLNTVLKNKFRKWEVMKIASWSNEDIISATKWLIEEKLCYTPEQVCNISVRDFAKYNLDGMLQKTCNHSILSALKLAYPGTYYRDKSRGISIKK